MVVLCGVRTNLWEMNNSMSPLHTLPLSPTKLFFTLPKVARCFFLRECKALETVPVILGRLMANGREGVLR